MNITVACWYPDFVMKTLSKILELKSIDDLNRFRLEVNRETKNRTLRVSLVQNA
jgi:hypothetical protein